MNGWLCMGIAGWKERHARAWKRLGQGRSGNHLGVGRRSSLGSLPVVWILELMAKSLHLFRPKQSSRAHRRSVAGPMQFFER